MNVNKRKKINSKQKGARFERELASRFRDYGYKARRTAQYCGNTGDASDVVGLPGIHIEAKHAEQMRLYEWIAQAKRDAEAGGENRLPAVFHRKNYAEVLVSMELDTWMQLYNEWQAGQYLKERECDEQGITEHGAACEEHSRTRSEGEE